tara:strand:- start:182 stop:430 length:249 start_codon:yes stop_codon:yes gene_type:complete
VEKSNRAGSNSISRSQIKRASKSKVYVIVGNEGKMIKLYELNVEQEQLIEIIGHEKRRLLKKYLGTWVKGHQSDLKNDSHGE